jgi:hypothetical protein
MIIITGRTSDCKAVELASAVPESEEANRVTSVLEVRQTTSGDPLAFEVAIHEGDSETRHRVTVARETCERLTGGKQSPERLIEAAFRFLLDREPKESILRAFDVTIISRYFPEFARELPKYLKTEGPRRRPD